MKPLAPMCSVEKRSEYSGYAHRLPLEPTRGRAVIGVSSMALKPVGSSPGKLPRVTSGGRLAAAAAAGIATCNRGNGRPERVASSKARVSLSHCPDGSDTQQPSRQADTEHMLGAAQSAGVMQWALEIKASGTGWGYTCFARVMGVKLGDGVAVDDAVGLGELDMVGADEGLLGVTDAVWDAVACAVLLELGSAEGDTLDVGYVVGVNVTGPVAEGDPEKDGALDGVTL